MTQQESLKSEKIVSEVMEALDKLEVCVSRLGACPNTAVMIDLVLQLRTEFSKAFRQAKKGSKG